MSDTVRWWKNGDHPEDGSEPVQVERDGLTITDLSEGKVVKRYSGEEDPHALCPTCGAAYGIHGWLGGPKTGSIVHPGDYIIADGTRRTVEREDPLAEQQRAMEAAEAVE